MVVFASAPGKGVQNRARGCQQGILPGNVTLVDSSV